MAKIDLSGTAAPSCHMLVRRCATLGSMKNLLAGLIMNYTNPSLSRPITSPRDQVMMEALHCVLNLVRSHFETLKLLCNKLFKAEVVVVDEKGSSQPVAKSQWEVDWWDASVRSDNSVACDKWRAQGWVLEDDLKRVVGFEEPLMGYHGNQCFKLLARWDAVCSIQVLKMLDVHLSECSGVHSKAGVRPFPSALRQWLTGLHNTCEEIRHTRSCVSALRSSIESWFGVIIQLHARSVGETWVVKSLAKMYTWQNV
jgi:hypothetical protein